MASAQQAGRRLRARAATSRTAFGEASRHGTLGMRVARALTAFQQDSTTVLSSSAKSEMSACRARAGRVAAGGALATLASSSQERAGRVAAGGAGV